MKNIIISVITAIVVVGLMIAGLSTGFAMTDLQKETLFIVSMITLGSAVYCFVVGEITRNNSQMDKLWSILPIAYAWVIAAKGGMKLRLVVMAVLVTLWGIRLTVNFGRKGAYSLKFWTGEEDYRWPFLRKLPMFQKRIVWALFDLFFISIYQNALVLYICLPMIACMESGKAFGAIDIIASILVLFFIIYELIADEQQMKFQTKKWQMIKAGKKLDELPAPYNLGFNTVGLWSVSRHPNYFAEQAVWVCLYIFVIGAGAVKYGIFNWTIGGSMMLVLLFMGSSMFGEYISSKKYPKYKLYQEQVFKYMPFKKFRG